MAAAADGAGGEWATASNPTPTVIATATLTPITLQDVAVSSGQSIFTERTPGVPATNGIDVNQSGWYECTVVIRYTSPPVAADVQFEPVAASIRIPAAAATFDAGASVRSPTSGTTTGGAQTTTWLVPLDMTGTAILVALRVRHASGANRTLDAGGTGIFIRRVGDFA